MVQKLGGVALFLLVAALTVTSAQAQTLKVAIVNAQKAVADTQEIKKAQAELSQKYQPRQQEIEKLQADLQQIQGQLQGQNLTPAKEQELNFDGQQKQKKLQRLSDDLQQDFNQDRADVLSRAGRHMQDVIKTLAEGKGLDVVIDTSNTLYFKPALDMTAEATSAYDKAYPVTAAAPAPAK